MCTAETKMIAVRSKRGRSQIIVAIVGKNAKTSASRGGEWPQTGAGGS